MFVTEVADIWLGDPVLTGYRTEPHREFSIQLEGERPSVSSSDGWRPFVNPYVPSAATALLPTDQADAQREIADQYAPHHVDDLRTLDGVVDAFALDGETSTTLQDRTGAHFLRFEQKALGYPDLHPHTVDWGAQQLGFWNAVTGDAWVLDVWADESGAVERVRLQTQEFRRHWAELRFADGGFSEELPGPDGTKRLGYGPSCPTSDGEAAELGWMGFEPWSAEVTTKVDATLDPRGRPFDAADDGGVPVQQSLGTIVATDGSVFVSDAFIAEHGGLEDAALAIYFDGAPEGDIELRATVLATTYVEFDGRQIYGIRLDVPGALVDHWTPFETAYCTDEGTGRISSRRSLEQSPEPDDEFHDVDVWIGDADDRESDDTIVFSNGFGNGCFPASRGLDIDDGTVSLIVWNPMYPWRLMVPDGTPPADITARENEIQECLDGSRAVEAMGFCSHDNS